MNSTQHGQNPALISNPSGLEPDSNSNNHEVKLDQTGNDGDRTGSGQVPHLETPPTTKVEENSSGSDSGNDVRSPSSAHLLDGGQTTNQQPLINQSQSPSNQSNSSSGFGDVPPVTPVTSSVSPVTGGAVGGITSANQQFFTPYSTSMSHTSFYPNPNYPYVPLDMSGYQQYSNLYSNQGSEF